MIDSVIHQKIECVLAAGDALGEGPLWSAREGALYRVDIVGRRVHRFCPSEGAQTSWSLPARPTALAERAAGGLLVAFDCGLAHFDPATGAFTPQIAVEPDRPGNRCNDGRCGPRGRFFIGTMDDGEKASTGGLHRYDPDGALTRLLDGVGIANTLAWSPDGGTFYFGDSLAAEIRAHAFDLDDGVLGPGRLFASTAAEGCAPDGSAMDADGCLWNAQWGGARVVRYRPDGRVDRVVRLPVAHPTSCAFGGPRLDVLFVTSAAVGLKAGQRARQPLAGGVFAFEPGVRGLPVPAFADAPAPSLPERS